MQRDPTESQILQEYICDRQIEQNEQTHIKKSYLKQSILDRYCNQEELIDKFLQFFLGYLKRSKGIETQDHNIDYLTLEQLQQLVAQFHKLYPPAPDTDIARAENPNDLNESRFSTVVDIKEEQFDAQKVYYSNGSWDYELIGYEECKRVKEYFAIDEDYNNNIVFFEKTEIKKTGGFFGIGGKYQLWIEIRSNLFKQNIMRRIDDFIFLRSILSKVFPYVFIYPLEITEKQLEKVNEQAVKSLLVSECRRFINFICKNELFLQNLNTHRFFKERNYQNYLAHQKSQPIAMINRIKLFENVDGCVPIQISDKSELMKKDSIKKGLELQRIWQRWEESNNRINSKLKDVQMEIQKQRKEMEKSLLQFTNVNPMLKSKIYEKMIQTIIGYSEVYKNYEENLGNFQFLFESVNLQVASQSKKIWTFFNKYSKEIAEMDCDYCIRRKVFLDKEAKQVLQNNEKAAQTKSGESEAQKKLDPVNKQIISRLGITSNSIKETAWIQRFSKWQGYINKQFINSYERLLQNDVEILNKILRQNVTNRFEMHKKEALLIKSLEMMP